VQGISGQKKLREKVVRLYASIAGYGGRPTASQLERLGGFRVEIEAANRQFLELTEGRLEELNSQLEQREQQPIALLTEEEFAAREN
jgi:predicted component of type VI protein secretion system